MSNSLKPLTIEIFRPGTFTSVEGTTMSFTADDLEELRASYDPAVDPAPIVVGHPGLADPAYGWADGLSVVGDRLVATSGQVDASFAEMVALGRFKKVSAQFYPREHPNNPTPGKLHLKHIGFLGAAAPAVKGLKPVSFADGAQAGCITFEIENSQPPNPLKDKKEPIVADKDEDKSRELSFAERETALDARAAKLAQDEATAKADRLAIDELAAKARHDGHVSFAESQIAAGKLAPAGKDQAVFIMDTLASAPTTLSFGEGDKAAAPVAVFQGMFAAAKPLISFAEVAKAEPKAESMSAYDIAMKARALVAAAVKNGSTLSYSNAVKQVTAGSAS